VPPTPRVDMKGVEYNSNWERINVNWERINVGSESELMEAVPGYKIFHFISRYERYERYHFRPEKIIFTIMLIS
jgi:hypothetical protein